MEELYAGLFRAMNRFGKLRIGELFSDMTKSDGMMLWTISQSVSYTHLTLPTTERV